MKTIGIDIGRYSLKIAEIEGGSRTPRLVRYQEVPLSADPNKDKRLEIIEILRGVASEDSAESTQFIFGLRQEQVAVRNRVFPFKERFKILKSLAFELEDDIPFSQDDAIFDAKLIRYQGNQTEVLALAAPNEHIQESLSLIHDCGIEPSILSLETLAINNFFENWTANPPERPANFQSTPEATPAEIVIDIGHRGTNVLAYSDGVLIGVQHVDWGALQIAESIAIKYNLHITEALKEVQRKSFVLLTHESANKDQAIFSDVIKESMDYLCHELRLRLLELQATTHTRITSAQLIGGGSQIKNLGAYLTQKLEIQVNRLKSLEGLGQIYWETRPQNELTSLVAIGLAIEGHKRAKNPAINFLQNEFAKQSQVFGRFVEKWGHSLQLLAAAFVLLLIYGFMKESLSLDLANQSSESLRKQAATVANLSGTKANPREIRRFIQKAENDEKNMALIEKVTQVNSALDIFKQINSVVPRKEQLALDITRLVVENSMVRIEGYVKSKAQVDALSLALRGLSTDGKVQGLSSNLQAKAGLEVFSFGFNVNRIEGE